MNISDSYLTDDIYADMHAICHPVLKKSGMTFFDFGRMYDDGSCVLLSNRKDVTSYLFTTQSPIFAPIPASLLRKKFYYLIPENGPYQKIMHDVRSYYNIGYGIDLFECGSGYVDVCCFASTADNEQIVNYYLNNIDVLENFRSYFKYAADDIIKKAINQTIMLPEHMRLNFDSRSYIEKKYTPEYQRFGLQASALSLTMRELQIARLLVRGKTAKEIAAVIDRSHRTVEHHIEKIKNKTGSTTRSELIQYIIDADC